MNSLDTLTGTGVHKRVYRVYKKKKMPQAPTTAVLNIRQLPRDLVHKVKVAAMERDITLREFVMEALQKAVSKKGPK